MTSRAEPKSTGVRTFGHEGMLFASPAELAGVVVPRIRSAEAAGEHVVVALADAHAGLVRAGLGAAAASVRFVDRARWYEAPGRTLAALHRLGVAHADRHVTVVGEPVLPLDEPLALREWHRLDSVLDAALACAPLRVLCVHDARTLPAGVRREVARTHPVLLAGPTGAVASRDYRDPVLYSAADAGRRLPAPTGRTETLEIVADLTALRERVLGAADRAGLTGDRLGDLVVSVNEMAANVLEHGAGKGWISLWRIPGHLVCDVFDEGGGLTDPLSGYYPTDVLSVRGYGLWITRQVCDFMEISGGPDGSLVRLYFRTAG
ncbi:sensor histidine kinase [Marinitenerispora sediminis]|uniref:Sensor histidine kinase n=1 Tax=Marinitenerispora sediminis TaxID=1931232 RepID=A0A368T407_9ACTN|nr:sensor histidine kinase [Marinitenerispora sediminis]RCV49626.1 sensor histidine kinase [Marinitenerispora sediminis]RCV53124.1 sensor histidine kinase [Marinitenerispora sediminis]RCV57168.1 sensor histidine kinase [Marinitenerispora sediminis]